jgi:hypothetical protein
LQESLPTFYPPLVRLLEHALAADLRLLVVRLLRRIGTANGWVVAATGP